MIDLLNGHFENVWMLNQDVRALAADEEASPELRALAAELAKNYLYPVDFQVVDVTGKLFAQGEANHMRKPYHDVLIEGLGIF